MAQSWTGKLSLLLLLAMLAATVAACGAQGAGQNEGIDVGKVARNFDLPSLAGDTVSLRDFRGQVVLVNFWASWCDPCRTEIPDFQVAYNALKDNGFVVLGVNVQETAEAIAPFVAQMGMTYPVVLDGAGKVKAEYRAPGLPMSLLLDEEGVIRYRHVGFMTDKQLNDYLADLMPAGE